MFFILYDVRNEVRRINMKRYLILFLLGVYACVTAFAQSDLQTVAIVRLTKSEPITVRQLKTELEKLLWQNLIPTLRRIPTTAELNRAVQNSTVQERRQVLDMMINERLVLQASERDRVTITDNELNQQIAQLRAQMAQNIGRQPTDDEFALAIKNETGQDMPSFREQMRRQLIGQKYLMTKKESQLSNVRQPTEAEIVNFYNLSKADFVRPETIRFSMIQVPYGADSASQSKAKELADRLNREIGSNPSRFDEAVMRGQTPNSGYQAGEGGYIPRNMEAQSITGIDFINTAFALKQGEVSKVIEGNGGYQIIKITEAYPQKSLELDDIFQPGVQQTVRQFISLNMLQQRQQETLARVTQELVTELRSGNPFQITENNLNW